MNIFDRIAMLFRSNVNAVISEFEQPEKMLNQIILDMRSQLVKAKQQVAAAIADEKRLQDQTRQELKEAEDWERRAMLAVQQNQDELAKQALMRRGEHISRGDQLNLTWQAHKQETDRLKDSLRSLNDNIEEANRKVRASAEIEEEFSGDKLANDFKRLEAAGGNQSAEMLLIQLKQKMGVLPAGTQLNNKALGAGAQARPEEEAVEVEEIHDENN